MGYLSYDSKRNMLPFTWKTVTVCIAKVRLLIHPNRSSSLLDVEAPFHLVPNQDLHESMIYPTINLNKTFNPLCKEDSNHMYDGE
jgi:hypothetical protein